MSKDNEIQVIDNNRGMRVTKGGTVEFSPELSQQICAEMISLGTQLISETGRVTVEYFKTQATMYYLELNTYIENQTLKSEERKSILQSIEKLTDKYVDLINETEDFEKREQLKSAYEFFADKQSKLYMDALVTDASTRMPKKTSLLDGLKGLFSRDKK